MSQTGLPSPPQQTTPTTEPDVQQSPSSQAPASASTPAPPAPQPPPPPPPPPPPAVASPQTDAPNDNNISLHNVITAITTAASSTLLNQNLKTFTPSKEIREVIFASFLPDGHDPLTVLDIQANTLGILYILSARLHVSGAQRPPINYIEEFCRSFVAEQARLAPERVTLLAMGIIQAAEHGGNLRLAVQPLLDLLIRYPPTPSHLTSIHPLFLRICVSTRCFMAALPILARPITTIDLTLSDLTYNDNLVYHYAGGMVYAALKRWAEAEEFFEICACSPGAVPAAIQLEAFKKLALVQLIHHGKTLPPPKYIHPNLPRLLKGTPYSVFINAYPQQRTQLRSILETDHSVFAAEKNLGLIYQALECAPRWSIRKLTATYLTLHISDIGQSVGITNEEEVHALLLDMIRSSEISARLSADGTVAFSDPPVKFEKADIDRVLAQAQEQSSLLARLEREMSRSKEYLAKAMKNKEDPGAWVSGAPMEEIISGDRIGESYSWAEDMAFM